MTNKSVTEKEGPKSPLPSKPVSYRFFIISYYANKAFLVELLLKAPAVTDLRPGSMP
jgi:hypothetical protein